MADPPLRSVTGTPQGDKTIRKTTPPEPSFDDVAFGPQRCQTVGRHLLDSLEAALLDAAEAKSGRLTSGEIAAVVESLRETPHSIWSFYQESFAHCLAASKTAVPLGYERRNLLMRLIAETFSPRFAENAGPGDAGPFLARAIIGPFEKALEIMLGGDFVERQHRACFETADDLKRLHGAHFAWPIYYADARAEAILMEVRAAIAMHFRNFAEHRKWFVDLLNTSAEGSASPVATHDGVTEFSGDDFTLLFSGLFANCADLSGGGPGLERLDAEKIAAIERLAGHLNAGGRAK